MSRLSSYRRSRSFTGSAGALTVLPSAVRTGTGNSGAFTGFHAAALAYASAPQARLTITAQTGTTPTLDVVVQDSPDGVTWTTRDTFPQQTGVATVTRALPSNLAAYQRVQWTIGGSASPSFTFSFQVARGTDLLT